MLKEFFFTKIEEEDIGNIWFQQDGTAYHTAEATLDVLFLKIALFDTVGLRVKPTSQRQLTL